MAGLGALGPAVGDALTGQATSTALNSLFGGTGQQGINLGQQQGQGPLGGSFEFQQPQLSQRPFGFDSTNPFGPSQNNVFTRTPVQGKGGGFSTTSARRG
jgi:hypothetical protein